MAEALAAHLGQGDVVYVAGELGAGKTTFIRAACRALGVTQAVTSPTYTVGNRYRVPGGHVSHLDLYRSGGVTIEEWADLEPYFEEAVVFVEWPAAGAGVLPQPKVTVHMRLQGGDARLITVECADPGLLEAIGRSLT
ncbi:MAG: tRNA (adenosine(37)-N6)-threonylcarbamoyltransferase complex ATPase subunit type 1 TsaE [Gaiellales bacterium]